MRTYLFATLIASALVVPRMASACGGFFCDRSAPVDQTSEQIIFGQEGGKATTYVQIHYQGTAQGFGWIIPVTQVPTTIELSNVAIFNSLEAATGPTFIAPAPTGGGGCSAPIGCGEVALDAASPKSGASNNGVDVVSEGTFGPFNFVVLSSGTASELLNWLTINNYNTPDGSQAIVQQYLDQNAVFVALKLLPDANVSDIQPIKMTFNTFEPCVPLRLTAISAQPHLGVIVYVFGETRAVPNGYGNVIIDDATVKFHPDGFGPTNYHTLVGQAVDAIGGRAFVTEFAGKVSTLSVPKTAIGLDGGTADFSALLTGSSYVTRLFTEISPENMTADPTFILSNAGQLPDVSNKHQLGSESLSARSGFETLFLGLAIVASFRRRKRPS